MRVVGSRFSPLKSTVGLRPPSSGGLLDPSFATKLFIEAQASIRVPSTVKCSEDTNPCHSARPSTLAKKERATVSLSSRSRFLVNTE